MRLLAKLLALFSLCTVGSVAFGQSCTTPFTDSFSGTGALGAAWTTPHSSGAPDTLTRASGTIVGPTSSGGIALLNNYCGVYPANQSVTTTVVTKGNYSGPVLRMSTAGTGYAWLVNLGIGYKLVNGTGIGGFSLTCPAVSNGDSITFSVDSTNITCRNNTTATQATVSDSTYSSGYPGLMAYQGFPLGPVTISSPISAPSFAPPGPRLATGGATVGITCSSAGTSAYYTTDGSTPTTSSTHSSSAPVTTSLTLKSICSDGVTNSTVTSVNYLVGSLNFYVETFGGTRYSTNNPTGQCNGNADVAYPGSGVNQNCAYGDIRWLWDDKNTSGALNWAFVGGDTVIISKDPYRIGYDDAPNTTGWCPGYGSGAASCFPSNFPSGTSSNHTRILGKNYAACSTSKTYINPTTGVPVTRTIADPTKTTELFGGFGLLTLFDMGASDYVDIQCFEMDTHNTEHCITHGTTIGRGQPPETPACSSTSPYAKGGLLLNYQTTNLTGRDLNIHGFSSNGIRGEFGAGIRFINVRSGFNNGPGWNMSGPFGDHANGAGASVIMDQYVLDGNGFVQEYPIVDPFPAIVGFSQSTQSQDADAIAAQEGGCFNITATNGLSIYNTEDAFDVLHVDGAGCTGTMLIDGLAAWGNMAGSVKSGLGFTHRTVRNSFLVINPARMAAAMTGAPSTYNKYLVDFGRGNDMTGGVYDNNSIIDYYNNTIISSINNGFDFACGTPTGTGLGAACGGLQFNLVNNLLIGAQDNNCTGHPWNCDLGGNTSPGLFYWSYLQTSPCCTEVASATGNPSYGTVTRSNNDIYNFRNTGTAGTGEITTSPQFVNQPVTLTSYTDETIFDAFNFNLAGGSPARAAGATLGSVTTDFLGAARTIPYDMGAVQVTGGTPTAPVTTGGTVILGGTTVIQQ